MLRHCTMLLVCLPLLAACSDGEARALLQVERAENARLDAELKTTKEAMAELRRQCDDKVQAREADEAAKVVEDWTRDTTIDQEVRRELVATEAARREELLRAERERGLQRDAAIRYREALLAEAERERARREAEEASTPPPRP